jgi:predicted transcriptional regulator
MYMKRSKITAPKVNLESLSTILKQLINPKKRAIVEYVYLSKYSTAKVIQQRCQINQPTVSRYLMALTAAMLLKKERVGSNTIYQINTKVWSTVKDQIMLLAY